ncbi:apolipoprotein B-100 isoform X2 [Betta splendens]|uniref:Apolipoprotein B-100 isoform X2 n=1 Tax=Betta splendens TaxID=158456 RepID=A0A8M1HA00_BETSP|nr:apolipoprotein B-100 isoform X2 [Betta splendens]
MGHSRLLLLLLSVSAVAQNDGQHSSPCLLTSRLKAYKTYVYQYTTESRNGVGSATPVSNGPKLSCQVEIEVPQTCRFIMHTRDCVLSEASVVAPEGRLVYRRSPRSEAFQAAMSQNPLKFSGEDVAGVQLFPEADEPVNILNVKRGIVSSLMVPGVEEEENGFVSTVHGQCLTEFKVTARKDASTNMTLSRDLSQCDHFYSRELPNSPLALLQRLHRPMSKLIKSTQHCEYQFDKMGKHTVAALCIERHIYIPFEYQDNRLSSSVTQQLVLLSSKRTNAGAFDVNQHQRRLLHFEDPDDKAPVQSKDAILKTLQDLRGLSGTDRAQRRSSLFHRLVTGLRSLRSETLKQVVPEMLGASKWISWQALFQCGTAECTSAILEASWNSPEVDLLVYWLSLQANPNAACVRGMLVRAQYKQSRAIMYALANTVKNFHKGEVTSEVSDVARFMETLLNGCSRGIPDADADTSFLVLRVIGVMGEAMQAVSPSLISSVLRCVKNPDIPLANQKAAIQALRLMNINDEIKQVLMEQYLDKEGPTEKRVASYLVLMKSPDQDVVRDIVNNLETVRDEQLQNFVVSHLNNIYNSNEPQMEKVREGIGLALRNRLSQTNSHGLYDGTSRSYKADFPFGFIQSNIISNESSPMLKEATIKATLKAFDNNYDLFEFGVEGSGFEPILEALFGINGFFTEIISKVMYLDILHRPADSSRMKRQVPPDFLKEIQNIVKRLIDDLGSSPSPKATAYLQLLGKEIGYLKMSDLKTMAGALTMYRDTLKVLPMKILHALTSSNDNDLFAQYIFMENVFSLPTTSGFPLKFSLAGVMALGTTGGLSRSVSSSMTGLSFMPSAGLEFITQMGVHVPDYVEAGLAMHTNIYHESSLKAQVSMKSNQMRLSIPAAKANTQLFSISNKILSVSSDETETVPSLVEDGTDSTYCQPLFRGLRLCTVVRYSNATSMDHAPGYPLNGESRFAVEIQPTGAVSEYTATFTDETLREGKRGRHKTESLKLTLKAEGDDPTEATVLLKYNHNKNVYSTEVLVPDLDVEAGIKLSVTDSDAKGKKMHGVTIDITSRNVPQLTLTGRTRFEEMKDAMAQVQMSIPALRTSASVVTSLRRDEDLFLELETDLILHETSYKHKASLRYDDDKFEVEIKSHLNSEIQKLIPHLHDHQKQLQELIDRSLDQRVAKTDMKLRHIVTKGIEAGNIWLDKLTAHFPYLAKLRSKRSISDLTLPALPEKLFLQHDSFFRYQFNKDKVFVSLPLPMGGKTSADLSFPNSVSVPQMNVPQIGLNVRARKYPLPSFTIPLSLDFTLPLLGLVEASTKFKSNFYSWEGSVSGGNSTVDVPSYVAQFKVVAQSPLNLLSYQLEGTGMMSGRADENLKYLVNSSFTHSLIEASISILESLRVTHKLNSNANFRIQASSPLGLQASVYYSAQAASTLNSDDVSGDGSIDGLIKIGSFYSNASYTHSYNLRPRAKEGSGESTLQFNCPFIHIHNLISGVYANSEFSLTSKTNAQRNAFKHVAELKYKAAQLTLKSSCVAKAMGRLLNNKVELGVSRDMTILRVESQADDDRNTAFWLITGTLDSNGLDVSSEGSVILDTGRGLHKTTVKVGRNGLTMSGTNSVQCSPIVIENVFTGAIDNRGAKLSSRTKAMAEEGRGELDIEARVTSAEVSVDAALKGHAYDASTRNTLRVGLDRRALTFNSHSEGTLRQMKTESRNALTLTLWTLALHSNTNNFICDDIYYKHDLKLGIKPFLLSFGLTNDARLYETSLSHEGSIKLQPSRADVKGSIKAAYGQEHNILHTYELSYNDLAGMMKYNLSGLVMEAQLSHSCQLEFAGFSSKTICEAQLTSEPLRFESNIRSMVLPFSLNVDASVSSDGEVHLFGKHTAQLYSRTLAKAEPLVFAYSHDNRVSTMHELQHGDTSTSLDNKYDLLLSPSDQSFIWTLKSKLNNHTYNQDIRAHNSPAKVGLEFSGAVFTNTFSQPSRSKRSPPQTEEFRMSGFLTYDKNIHCHVIHVPYVQSFPAGVEQLKTNLIEALESLQQFINSLDINQLIADFRAMLDQLPAQVSAFMKEMDLERKVSQVKAKIDYLIKEFSVSLKDLELIMKNLRKNLEKTVIKTATNIRNMMLTVKDYVKEGHLANDITRILEQVGNQLQALDGRYEIKQTLLRGLYATEDVIRQIDLQKLTEGSAAWLRELNAKYQILETIKDKLSEIRKVVENFNVSAFSQELIDNIMSVDLAGYVEQLVYRIPSSEIANVLESMNDVIVNWIDEYEVAHKINTVYFYIRDLLVKYNIDSGLKDLMDQAVILIKEFKVEQTVQTLVKALKSAKFEFVHDHILQFLHRVTSHIRSINIKKSIDDFNKQISLMLKLLKEFNYSVFVDETNKKVVELTNYVNEQIRVYEIVEKVEAVREFVREIQKSVFEYLDELKNTKVADALKKLRKVIDTTFYNDIKLKVQDVLEDMRQRILDMDIRQEIYIHLQRASEFYNNVVTLMSSQINRLIDRILTVLKDNGFLTQMKQSVDRALGALMEAEVHVAAFTVPFTDLRIPEFTINLNKLQDIKLPAQILVPKVTILGSYTIPAITIDFEDLKAQIIAFLDRIKEFQIPKPNPEQIFGDLKLLYLCDLPDFTLPKLTLSEIKFFPIHIPILNLTDFKITMLPVPEIKLSKLRSDICLPLFGKLHGEFRLVSPQVTVVTTGKVENSTSSSKNPQFTATVASYATSPIESLKYTFEASALLEAPRMKKLIWTEKVKASHATFSIDHDGSLMLTGSFVETSLVTSAKATTQMYTADLVNRMTVTSRSGISAAISTIYSHNVAIPSLTVSNQVSIKQNIGASVESGRMTLSSGTTGEGQWSIQDYSDEASHKSNVEVNIDLHTANLTFIGNTDSNALKLKQTLMAESVTLSHFTVEAKCEAKAPYVKNSVVLLNLKANLEDLKLQLTASHEAVFTGALSGSMSNLLRFVVHPFETVLEATNKVNSKLSLPLKLTGKVDLQHDYGIILNSEKQQSYCFALARFNQYKYKHNFTAENNDVNAFLHASLNAEANLDFLTVPLSVPEITVPYLQLTTPELRDVSLWRDAGLQALLNTPQQVLDLNLKLFYSKNPDKHSFDVYLEPIYSIISDNAEALQAQFEQCRDQVVTFLKASYSQAKSQYVKHRLDPPNVPSRVLVVPGYRIPSLNIDVSAFRVEMPVFGYTVPKEFRTPGFKVPALGFSVPSYTLVLPSLEIPVIHVPESLSEMRLPTLTLPALPNHVTIPAMGNMSWDFSFKSTVMGVSAHAGLYNQTDIVAHFDASSTSVFDILNGKIDGTTSLTQTRGLKVATTVSLDHSNVEANHDSSVSLSERNIQSSVANYVMFKLPFLNLELNQKLTGSTETKPNVASMKKVKYVFNIPLIESVGEGHVETNWALEAVPSYVSLETSTEGKSDVTVMGGCNIAGEVKHGASFYLDANGLRSTVRTALNSDINKQEKQKRSPGNVIHFDFNKTFALDVSLRRMFAAIDYSSRNHVDLAPFNTNGRHNVKGELDFAPLTTFRTTLSMDASQPSRLGPTSAVHSITAAVGSQRQAFTWRARHQLATLTSACDLLVSNEESEIRVDLSTAVDALNVSLNVIYTKAVDGQEYAIPSTSTDSGVTFSLPDISFVMPSWLKKLHKPLTKSTDTKSERSNRLEHVTLLPVVSVPAFNLPFTNLQVEAFTVDPKSVTIPKVITTKAFESTHWA